MLQSSHAVILALPPLRPHPGRLLNLISNSSKRTACVICPSSICSLSFFMSSPSLSARPSHPVPASTRNDVLIMRLSGRQIALGLIRMRREKLPPSWKFRCCRHRRRATHLPPILLADISELPGEAVISHEGRCSVSVWRKRGSLFLMAAREESCDETTVAVAAAEVARGSLGGGQQ